MSNINVTATTRRDSLHPSITAGQISELVERFYIRVLANDRLAPIFEERAGATWDAHLETMNRFWRSVLLRTGEYKGKPVPVHQKLSNIGTEEFEEWLSLFEATSREVFSNEAAPLVNEAAERIASSLWLARNSDPFASPPEWRKQLSVASK